MSTLIPLLNSLSPLGLATLLALILWTTAGSHRQIRQITATGWNGNGSVPDMLRRIEASLIRIEASLMRQEGRLER